MTLTRMKYRLLLLTAIFFTAMNAFADTEHFFNSISGSHFSTDSSVYVSDDKFMTPLWSTIEKNLKVTDVVTFELNEDTNLYLNSPTNVMVQVEVTFVNQYDVADSFATSLNINFDTNRARPFNYRTSLKFSGGYSVKTRILAVYYNGVMSISYPKIFTFAEDIYVDRIYKFNCDSAINMNSCTYDAVNQRLDISWPPYLGADNYDLEFTYYDHLSQLVAQNISPSYNPTTYSDFNFIFQGNATRVNLYDFSYSISLIYDTGYVFYRVRPIHYDSLGKRIEGAWSSDLVLNPSLHSSTISAYPDQFVWQGHEPTLNWQYTAAYAEEGKRKEVTSYFDGSLRNRQSVTLNNTENKAIIGETIYDHQGRPAVTTLPAPLDSGRIAFYELYNLNGAGLEYSRYDFDTGVCGFIPPPMDSLYGGHGRGSSGYYSSSNPDANIGFDRYLPDGAGYPFTETVYTPDNTGRISSQSIAGKTHTIGSGHETKYYYGTPSQEQLDRLFGSEVGDQSHYLENMVIDADSQISVSYVDENGKTIATALAGQPPHNLSPLPSYYPADSLTINLLNRPGEVSSPSIANSYGLLATNRGRYYFSYKLLPGNYTDSSCSKSIICDDCLYDVELMVTGGCGSDPPLIIKHDTNFTYKSIHPFDTTCHNQNITDTFSLYLTPGNYTITRIITVDAGAINFYTQRYLTSDSCIKNYSYFYNQAILNTDFSGCGMTCQTCLASLGTESGFLTKYITTLIKADDSNIRRSDTTTADSLYNAAVAKCNLLCQPPNECQSLYDQMLADVSLGGQYCTYDTLHNGQDTAENPVSVLVSDYKTPLTPYVNSAGVRDTVIINNIKYLPKNLDINDFIHNWKPSWDSALVQYHPEYCYYKYCEMDTASNRYDYQFMNANSYAQAYSEGLLNPLNDTSGIPDYSNPDPYFQSGGLGYDSLSEIQYYLKRYAILSSPADTLSAWQAAALLVNCAADTLSGAHITFHLPVFGSGCAGDNNMEWNFFRGLYLAKKQAIQNSLENQYVAAGGCSSYAECIGSTTKTPCAGTPYDTMEPRHLSWANVNTNSFEPSPVTPATEQEWAREKIKSSCDTICSSYAYEWYEKLNNCGAISSHDSALLMRGFELVCEAGCNNTHPTGSSTTPGYVGDSAGDRDFEDVIVRVLGVSRYSIPCDSLDITMPLPYVDSNGVAGPPIAYFKPDTCLCGKLNRLHSMYAPDSASQVSKYKNFADYLNKNFGGTITDSAVYSLMGLCNDTSCHFLTTPVQLSVWMTCCKDSSYWHTYYYYNTGVLLDTTVSITQGCCIKCSDIDAGMTLFRKEVGPGVTDTSRNYQTLLTNFLNNLYGFNLTYAQYIAFDSTCAGIHCSVTESYWTRTIPGPPPIILYGETSDSVCGGINALDSIFYTVRASDTIRSIYYRHVTGAPTDSIAPTLCNEPIEQIITPAPPDSNACLTQLVTDAGYNAKHAYSNYLDSVSAAITENYIAHCMNVGDSFNLREPFDEYHYTLYYYDQAENLVKTIPPQGVHPITAAASLDSIINYRKGTEPNPVYPFKDSLASRYWFNTLNSPIQQHTPDGDTTHFWYDRLGRLALSQNAIQKPLTYSYTQYDPIGRITEVGQVSTVPANLPECFHCVGCTINYGVTPVLPDTFSRNDASLQHFINTGTKTQVTHTWYDSIEYTYIPLSQQNLRKRIASITYQDVYDNIYTDSDYVHSPRKYDNAIHYTYDVEGNVASMLIDDPHDSAVKQRYKRLDYYYDVVSGKVNEIVYQHDSIDQFIHVYEYDADNRITDVLTSQDSLYWEQDASYGYYDYGPLAREVIGRRQVQGVDYAYTLNGWVKAVNSSISGGTHTSASLDMGHDADVHDPATASIGKDAYGFSLDYFAGDYRPIGSVASPAIATPVVNMLYNGNISGATYSSAVLKPKTIGYTYRYDQLNRIVQMQAYMNMDTVHNLWAAVDSISSFREKASYDENGNILTYLRRGNTLASAPLAMDSLNYEYKKGTNQLRQVLDAVPAANYPNDIDNEPDPNNYQYNAIGELAKDSAGGLDTITWTIYGKVKKIVKHNGDSLVFAYDPLGNRLEKRYYHNNIKDTTIYARDAQGNILAIYDRKDDSVKLTEFDLYGSKRIGTIDTVMLVGAQSVSCSCTPPPNPFDSNRVEYLEGQRRYELDNHLGNVLAIIDDRKIAVDTANLNYAQYYIANILQAQDYYPFGMVEPGRNFESATYRYAFNGKEKVDEIYGENNSYDYGKRFYDARIARFMSTDPLFKKYPELSTYQFASNTPIWAVDLDGQERMTANQVNAVLQGASHIQLPNAEQVEQAGKYTSWGGTGLMVIGVVLTATGVGAEVGVPMFTYGGYLSTAGTAVEVGSQLSQGKIKEGSTTLAFVLASEFGGNALLRSLKLEEKSLGGQLISLNVEANSIVSERLTNTILEKTENKADATSTPTIRFNPTVQGTTNPSNMEGAQPVDQGRNILNFKPANENRGANPNQNNQGGNGSNPAQTGNNGQNQPTDAPTDNSGGSGSSGSSGGSEPMFPSY